jgi:ATP-dependent exoDNAse (exonuclease V) beta subunit
VEWVRNIRASEQREATADMNIPGDSSAVSIMTVHKAKGLEFPVVFLPGMNQQPRSVTTGPPAIVEEVAGGARMALKDESDPVYAELWERERDELRREHERLLYVAMTRARDHLIMLGTIENGKTPYRRNGWLSMLHQAVPMAGRAADAVPVVVEYAYPHWKPEIRPGAAARTEEPVRPGTGKRVMIDAEQVKANIAPLAASRTPEWKKATDLLAPEMAWSPEQPALREERPLPPLVRGSILHRCIEEHGRSGTCDLSAVLAGFPEFLSLDPDARDRFAAETRSVLEPLFSNAELAWIFHPRPGAYSELPFLLRRKQEIISGVIDRLVIRDGRGYVIDFKAIQAGDDSELQPWIEHYRPQLGIYCEAAKEMFRLESVEGYLFFLDSGRLARVH